MAAKKKTLTAEEKRERQITHRVKMRYGTGPLNECDGSPCSLTRAKGIVRNELHRWERHARLFDQGAWPEVKKTVESLDALGALGGTLYWQVDGHSFAALIEPLEK